MQCEDARRRILAGPDQAAEGHVAECATCFAVLEERDPLVATLRAARPQFHAVPAAVATGVLQRWQPVRLSWPLGVSAMAALLALAVGLTALTVWLNPSLFARPVAVGSNAVDVISTLVNGCLAVPRVLLFDRPAVLAGSAVLIIIACGLWVRLFQVLELQRRRISR